MTQKNKITITTSRFGKIMVVPEKIITMVTPFLGFPESTRFILRPHNPDSPFMWFQSIDDGSLAFVVIQSVEIAPEYQPLINVQIKKELQITTDRALELLLILTIPQDKPEEMTVNLLGPLVINGEKRLAKQVILDSFTYDPCQPVFKNDFFTEGQ